MHFSCESYDWRRHILRLVTSYLTISDVIQALRAKILTPCSSPKFFAYFFLSSGLVLPFISRVDCFLLNILQIPIFSLSVFHLIRLCLYHSFFFCVSFSDWVEKGRRCACIYTRSFLCHVYKARPSTFACDFGSTYEPSMRHVSSRERMFELGTKLYRNP